VNPFKGLGILLAAGIVVLALTRVSNVSLVIFIASIVVVCTSTLTLIASAQRRRRDRRVASGLAS